MREHFVGRTPRLTAYFSGIGLGLALLVAGIEATRVDLVELSGAWFVGYAVVGALGGVGLAFVAGYLNGSIVASWTMGAVPAAGLLGEPLASGTTGGLAPALLGAVATGVLLGTVGFVLAVVKHRRDSLTADLPAPASRADVVRLVVLSVLLAGVLFAASGSL